MTHATQAIKKAADESVAQHTKSDVSYFPNVDIVETADALVMYVDLPGVSADSIDVDFNQGTLSIYAKAPQRQAEDARYLLREYGVGDFYRAFQISEDVDSSQISASYRDGVLQLSLPKAEAVKPRKIAVTAS
jgi:HSP20 family molecular chaperone IbpA